MLVFFCLGVRSLYLSEPHNLKKAHVTVSLLTAERLMNIKELSDKKLVEVFGESVKEERKVTLLVLELVAEMDSRKLYLKHGYSSLFVYLTTELNYSEGATHRRIASARAVNAYPEVKEMLLDGRLSLTNLSMLSKELTEENKDKLLSLASYKSTRELEKLLLDYKPAKKKMREKIKPVVVKKELRTTPLFDTKIKQESENHFRRRSSSQTQEVEKRLNLSFSVPEETQSLIDEAKQVLSGKLPKGASLEDLFVAGLESIIAGHKKKTKSLGTRKSRKSKKRTRHIPNDIRKAVLERDEYKCSFKAENGKVCGCNWNIEVDHIVPFADGGEHLLENLRVLCGSHHQYVTEKRFGKVWEVAA